VARFIHELGAREELGGARDHDGLEVELAQLARHWTWKYSGRGTEFAPGLPRTTVVVQRDDAKALLDRTIARADADLAALLREELRPVLEAYARKKAQAGKLDFLDLLLGARDLVRDHAAVRRELQGRFSHLLVDEFQDTDPVQAELLFLLSADDPACADWARARPVPGKLFVVGDPKQSIYRFRRADVQLYQLAKQRLLDAGASLLHLQTSFRSAPAIQATVNAAFARVMQGGGQAEYVPLLPYRGDPPDRPSVVALPVPRPYGNFGKITTWQIEKSAPDAVGAYIDFLLHHSGWRVGDGDGARPIQARDVCILFKRLQNFGEDVTRAYVRALEVRRIPHVLVGGRSFHAREELLAVRNALAAIEWPDDELSVYATLRGPFFALGDDHLLAWKHQVGSLHTLRRHEPADPALAAVALALTLLARLHLARNRQPIAVTLGALLTATRAHAGIAIWPTGEQALANVLRVMDLARQFERSGGTSFRAFVHRLEAEAERGGASEAPVVEAGTEGVRMMTVHKAKGLEFPVVILAEPTAPAAFKNPSRLVDPARGLCAMSLAWCVPVELEEERTALMQRDTEEATRLLYVAATRARDLLVVPVVGDVRQPGWVDALHPALYPPPAQRRAAEPAVGCPAFGKDSVLDRPPDAPGADASVAPGSHAPEATLAALPAHRVCFWDPFTLALDREVDVGQRQQRVLEADPGESVARASLAAHDAWQAARAAGLARGSIPSVVVRVVTDLAAVAGPAPPVALESTTTPRATRPRGRRFGRAQGGSG
jgi:ATP-dependent exoDNAse (exonuclease V) beta subunit